MRALLGILSLYSVRFGLCAFNTSYYPSYGEVNNYLWHLEKHYSHLLTVVKGGTSAEGRAIRFVKISTSGFVENSKPVIYIDALIHADEWISMMAVLYAMEKLLKTCDLMKKADWILLPIMNPDGYEYSYKWDRFWRKTRSKSSSRCQGVDANRNFEYSWGDPSGSSDPCAADYRGSQIFSEIETRIAKAILNTHKNRLHLHISFHAWGSRILYPYSVDHSPPYNAELLQAVGEVMAKAMNNLIDRTTFREYQVGNAFQMTGVPVSGSEIDYVKILGVPLVFRIDLPGIGKSIDDRQGVVLPVKYIRDIVEGAWEGIKAASWVAVRQH